MKVKPFLFIFTIAVFFLIFISACATSGHFSKDGAADGAVYEPRRLTGMQYITTFDGVEVYSLDGRRIWRFRPGEPAPLKEKPYGILER